MLCLFVLNFDSSCAKGFGPNEMGQGLMWNIWGTHRLNNWTKNKNINKDTCKKTKKETKKEKQTRNHVEYLGTQRWNSLTNKQINKHRYKKLTNKETHDKDSCRISEAQHRVKKSVQDKIVQKNKKYVTNFYWNTCRRKEAEVWVTGTTRPGWTCIITQSLPYILAFSLSPAPKK